MVDYELSENQQKFVDDATNQGFEVDYTYSGRAMYGKMCPSIDVDNAHSFNTEADVCQDQMGRGIVIYAKR